MSACRLEALLPALDAIAPLAGAEGWDHVGLLLGDGADAIARVLVTIDLSPAVLQEARLHEAQLVVAYHPPWFGAKQRLVGGESPVLLAAARAGLALYSPHTALDAAAGGTNDVLADAAGVQAAGRAALVPAPQGAPSPGMGRAGPLAAPQPLASVVAAVQAGMGVCGAWVAECEPMRPIRRVAVCAGAGDSLLDAAIAAGADVYITGELRHHAACQALAAGMAIVALRHTASERAALAPYAARIAAAHPELVVRVSARDRDPFEVVLPG